MLKSCITKAKKEASVNMAKTRMNVQGTKVPRRINLTKGEFEEKAAIFV
jgi:hypothetical protein